MQTPLYHKSAGEAGQKKNFRGRGNVQHRAVDVVVFAEGVNTAKSLVGLDSKKRGYYIGKIYPSQKGLWERKFNTVCANDGAERLMTTSKEKSVFPLARPLRQVDPNKKKQSYLKATSF